MQDVVLWIATGILLLAFAASAAVKGTQTKARTIGLGMTGVAVVSLPVMRLIALVEALGIIGLVAPYATGILPLLTPLAAIGLGVIMVLAVPVHLRLGEPTNAAGNVVLLALCVVVAVGRWPV